MVIVISKKVIDNIYALGAATSADCDFQARLLESQLELFKLNQDRQVRVVTAEDETKQLIRDALYASTITDLFSGSKINMYVLTKEILDKFLSYEIIAVRTEKQADYTLTKGTTEVLSINVKKIEYDVVNEKVKATETHEAMELA
ncbi:unnamed protein product [Rotaria sp. Silwood1]|nr:unnamed protein product [Rotaria sp. Silwood1]CAF1523156.1 unnamed protein product [Rotaria sp. Silwood1]